MEKRKIMNGREKMKLNLFGKNFRKNKISRKEILPTFQNDDAGNSAKTLMRFRKSRKFNFAKIGVASLIIFALTFGVWLNFAPKNQNSANAISLGDNEKYRFATNQIFYAYLKSGEKLAVDYTYSSLPPQYIAAPKNFNATIYSPAGTVVANCAIPDGTTTEMTGTNCDLGEIVAPENGDGIYKIVFSAATAENAFLANITVKSAESAEISGRIWANQLYLLQQNQPAINGTFDLNFYAVNDAGNIYSVKMHHFNGMASRIYLNAVGNAATANTCDSAYASQGSWPYETAAAKTKSPAGTCAKYRIFLEAPNADLPASANSADGILQILPVAPHAANTALEDLEATLDTGNLLTNLSFTEDQTAANKAGTLTFNVNKAFAGNYVIQVDANNDGDFDDAVDRDFPASAPGGDKNTNISRKFDGKDGAGANISPNSVINFRAKFDKLGEIHLTMSDVEGLDGITMTMINGASAGSSTLYWDDTLLAPVGTATATGTGYVYNDTPIIDGRAGFDSSESATGGKGRHGWTFAREGANTDENGDVFPLPDGATSISDWGNDRSIDNWTYLPTNIATNLSITAPSLLVVNFVSNGGNSVAQQKVSPSTVATAPTPPAREHYTFAGWYLDDETFANVFSFSTKITQNTTLYAKWTEIRHDVSFNLGCETSENCSENPETENVFDGDSAEKPAQNPTRENQIFKGWQVCAEDGSGNPDNSYSYTGENNFYDFSAEVLEETELCAVWNPEFTVDFVDEDGDVIKSEKVENGDGAAAPNSDEILARDGEKFVGWDKKFDKITGNLKVVAIYKKLCEWDLAIFEKDENCVAPKENSQIPTAPNTGFRGKIFARFQTLSSRIYFEI